MILSKAWWKGRIISNRELGPMVKDMKPQLTLILPVFDFSTNPQNVLIMSLQDGILNIYRIQQNKRGLRIPTLT